MSGTLAAAVFLPLAPVGMALCYWRGKVVQERRHVQAFADEVEFWMVVRHRG